MTDKDRIDWLARAGDVWISMAWDCPKDGQICVSHDLGETGWGVNLRDAIDDAMEKEGEGES